MQARRLPPRLVHVPVVKVLLIGPGSPPCSEGRQLQDVSNAIVSFCRSSKSRNKLQQQQQQHQKQQQQQHPRKDAKWVSHLLKPTTSSSLTPILREVSSHCTSNAVISFKCHMAGNPYNVQPVAAAAVAAATAGEATGAAHNKSLYQQQEAHQSMEQQAQHEIASTKSLQLSQRSLQTPLQLSQNPPCALAERNNACLCLGDVGQGHMKGLLPSSQESSSKLLNSKSVIKVFTSPSSSSSSSSSSLVALSLPVIYDPSSKIAL